MKVPSEYPELLKELVPVLVEDLQRMGLNQDCERIAFQVAERIRIHFSGEQVYIPKGRLYKASELERQIKALFTGHNQRELCRRFGVTQRHLYRILKNIELKEQQNKKTESKH